jgi:hypothetical protein
LSHVGSPATALAAEGFRTQSNEIDGIPRLGKVGSDADCEACLAVFCDAYDGHDAGPDLLFAVVDETAQILGLNAAEFYGFDVDALQPIADEIGPTTDDLGQTDPAAFAKWDDLRDCCTD